MSELNPLQEALLPHFSDAEVRQILVDSEVLSTENTKLKERIEHLEFQIVTHAYGGWQTH